MSERSERVDAAREGVCVEGVRLGDLPGNARKILREIERANDFSSNAFLRRADVV